MKRFISIFLSCVIFTTCFSSAYAGYEENMNAESVESFNFETMSEDISNLEFIQLDLSDKVIYTYEQNDKSYKVEETLKYNDNNTEIESNIYQETLPEQYTLVETLNTTVNKISETSDVEVTVRQNDKIVAHDFIYVKNAQVSNEIKDDATITPTANYPIYEWRYQGMFYGNTKIIRYTVSAIITVLATAVGFKTASIGGTIVANALGDIAKNVILDHIPLVYWKMQLWDYYMNNSITWHYVGNKSKAWFYSDSKLTNLLNVVEEVDI